MDLKTLSDAGSGNEDSAGEMPVIPEKLNRLIKRRRPQSNSFSYTGQGEYQVNSVISCVEGISDNFKNVSLNNKLPYSKNSRKSRQGSKTCSKKTNPKDILYRKYDEMGDVSAEYESDEIDPGFEKEEIDRDVAEDRICDLLVEFYSHVNFTEFYASLKELNITSNMRKFIPLFLINFAMQHKSVECEFTSELLLYLYKKFLSANQMMEGFNIVLGELPDIILDVPKAPELIGRFIARAIADEILPKKFLNLFHDPELLACDKTVIQEENKEKLTSRSNSGSSEFHPLNSVSSSAYGSLGTSLNSEDAVTKAIEIADKLLSLKESFSKLDDIWGEKVGQRANRFLVYKFQLIIKQYTSNKDIQEVNNSLLDLSSPHFHHELAYQIFMCCMESNGDDKEVNCLINLLSSLCSSVTITKDQLEVGVNRLFAEMPLIDKEMPCAYIVLNRLMKKALDAKIISEKLFKDLPVKSGRKRFVSEGDFLIKSTSLR